MSRTLGSVVLIALVLAPTLRAEEDAASWRDVEKSVRSAFKPLEVAAPARLEKDLRSRLPRSIEITSAPFERLIDGLVRPLTERLDARERGMKSLAQHPSSRAGRLVEVALATLAKEDRKVAEHVADVEAIYAKVFRRGWMDASQGQREDRMLSAVLIPFYRRLLFRAETARAFAVDALAAMTEGEGHTWLLGAATRGKEPSLRAAASDALGRVGSDEALDALRGVLERDKVSSVRVRALAALLRWPVGAVTERVVAALGDDAWEVRALAVAVCRHARLHAAVPDLVDALAEEDGRLRQDIEDALFVLTGVRMYGDVARWRRWWAENQADVLATAKARAEAGEYERVLGPPETWDDDEDAENEDEERRGGTTSFYGITTQSKRILFVVDISRSMDSDAERSPSATGGRKNPYEAPRTQKKIHIARWQLHRVIHELPEDATFGIVVYSESYALWGQGMSKAKKRAKTKAHAFVDGVRANGTTNICDALDKALEMAGASPLGLPPKVDSLAADTIFLLSDGVPNRGRIANLAALEQDVVRRARRHGIVVHAVGIGEAAGSTFLKAVARRTRGKYVGFP